MVGNRSALKYVDHEVGIDGLFEMWNVDVCTLHVCPAPEMPVGSFVRLFRDDASRAAAMTRSQPDVAYLYVRKCKDQFNINIYTKLSLHFRT